MAESEKGDASSAETPTRSSNSDDFGKDFLNSWKSISVPEDDGLDFNKEAVSKGKKKSFNFDKLDMDFSLDGDFGKKISSFNVDMSDLDFSSPPKKLSKPKEKSTEECPSGKQGGKQSRFAFDFNFNELDSFDFGSSLPKGKLKSDKAADLKEFDSPGKQEKVQTARNKPVASIDLPGDDFDLDSSFLKGKNKSEKAVDLKGFDSPGKQAVVQTAKSMPNTSIDLPEGSLDSSLVKGKKSDKAVDLHDTNSPVKQKNVQTVKNKPVASMDLPDDRDTDSVPTSEYQETTKSAHLVVRTGKASCINGSPSTSANLENLSPSHSTAASPEKETSMEVKEDQCSQQSQTTVSTELKAETTHRDSSVPSISMEGSVQGAGSDAHGVVYSMAIEEKSNPEKALDVSVQLASREDSPRIPFAEPMSSKNGGDVTSGNQSDVGMEDTSIKEMNKGNTDSNLSSVRNLAQKTLHSTMLARENNEKSKLLAQFTSEPTVHQLTKEKGQCSIQSKYFNKSFRTESQLDTQSIPKKTGFVSNTQSGNARLSPVDLRSEPSTQQPIKEKGNSRIQSKYFNKSAEAELHLNSQLVPKQSCSVNSDEKTENVLLSPEDSTRQECTSSNDAHAGIQKVNNSRPCEPVERKGIPIILGNGKNDEKHETSAGFQVHSSSLPPHTIKSTTPKSLNSKLASSITAIRNSKSSDSEGNKVSHLHVAKKTLEASSLKVSRFVSPKAALPTKPLIEMKSLRPLEKSTAIPCKSAKIDHTASVEKTGPSSPSMKRKMDEEPDVNPVTLYPSKRATVSPKERRIHLEISVRSDKKQVRMTENHLDGFHSSPILDVPRGESPTQLGISLLAENDVNVEKAEAYGKELDEICNMLRKKHEEAKELLVRAVVNNNKLLMLNHPIYEEKVRMVRQFARLMLSTEHQN